jgi:uncharacterized repeat protein (TIGR03837 family)
VLFDIFCKVIDNHGDIGVCWRLAAELAARGQSVRLWVDDPSALAWMAPGGHERVEIVHWQEPAPEREPGDVVIEAFGCDPPERYVAALAAKTARLDHQPPWFNLEYLSAEAYVERSHGLASPVMQGPGRGLVKRFVYPGFTQRTGGLLREQDLASRQAAFDRDAWLRSQGIFAQGLRLVSLFCYEPPALAGLLRQLQDGPEPTLLLVTEGRARAAVRRLLPQGQAAGHLAVHELPLLSQADYDHLLWACDFNFVRGEDSLVRALWAGRPFAWQLYPQEDEAHHAKLEAFLECLQPPDDLRRLQRAWNGVEKVSLPAFAPGAWAGWARLVRERALALPELTAHLLHHAARPATI